MRICIYAAASDTIDVQYIKHTEELGETLALHGHSLVYGGGASGLMGAAARGFKRGGGTIIGVTPHFMHTIEPIFEGCTELIETEDMADRKEIMETQAEAFLIVPGGIGTFDEFFQCLTLKDLGQFDKPIVVYNVKSYFTDLLKYLDTCIEKGFIKARVCEQFKVAETTKDVLKALT